MKSPTLLLPFLAAWLSCELTLRAGGVVQDCQEAALREALQGGGRVTFACAGTIVLTQPLVIAADTILDATGQQVTLSGGQSVQLFAVHPGTLLRLVDLTLADGRAVAGGALGCEEATVILEHCTLTGHQAVGAASPQEQTGSMARGGALFAVRSNVQLLSCLLTNNQAVAGAGGPGARQGARGGVAQGGAVWIGGGALKMSDCRLIGNEAIGGAGGTGVQGGHGGDALGGGVYCDSDDVELVQTEIARSRARGGSGGLGTLQNGPNGGGTGGGLHGAGGWVRLTACTVASCEAAGSPPNPASGGGLANLATLTALNSTVASNYTTMSPAGDSVGGGIYNRGFLTAEHCTVAANEATGGAQNKGGNLENAGGYVALRGTVIAYCKNQWEVFGGVIDQGGNLCEDATAHFTNPTSRNLMDPKLGPLADNGGPVRTMIPLPGSPVVDAVPASSSPGHDARGQIRPAGSLADAGAVEGAALAPVLSVSFEPLLVRTHTVATLHVGVTNPNPFPLQGLSIPVMLPASLRVTSAPPATLVGQGAVEAIPASNMMVASFPSIDPGGHCAFSAPVLASVAYTNLLTLTNTTSQNLGSLAGAPVSATLQAKAAAEIVTQPALFQPDGTVLLQGSVQPIGLGGSAHFEYGTNDTFGWAGAPQPFAPGVTEFNLETAFGPLPGGTGFHARIVVVESGQTVAGPTVSFATPTAGAGTALLFDGADDWVKVERGFLEITNAFTLEFWAKPTAGQVLPWGGEGINGVYRDRPLRLAVGPADGSRYGDGHVGVGVSVATNGVVVFEHGPNNFVPVLIHAGPLTGWTHLAVLYGEGAPRLFLDGILVRTGLASPRIHHPSLDLGRGDSAIAAADACFAGSLDEVRVWDRALTQEELLALAQAPSLGTEPGLVACLHLDEGAGATVRGAAPNEFEGTLLNQPTWMPSTVPVGAGFVFTQDATDITAVGGVLHGSVNGGPAGGRAYFQWGLSDRPSQITAAEIIPPGLASMPLTATLGELRPGMDYRFRAVIEIGGTTTPGPWLDFKTKTSTQAGLALSLNGGDDAVLAGAPFASVIDNFTMEFWVRPTGSRPATPESISTAPSVDGQPWVFFPQYGVPIYGDDHAVAGISVGTNGVSVFEHGYYYRPSVLVHDADLRGWVHVALVYRQRQSTLLVNGVRVRDGLLGPKPVHPSGDLANSTRVLSGGPGMAVGDIDEVRIWTLARSDEDIRRDIGRRLTGTETGLALYYDFDSGPGAEVPDLASSSRRGTVAGLPRWIESNAPIGLPGILRTFVQALGSEDAVLAAEIDPRGYPTTAEFEWGPTAGFGVVAPPLSLDPSSGPAIIGMPIRGLTPTTSYQWRLVLSAEGHYAVSLPQSLLTRGTGKGTALAFDGRDDFVAAPSLFGSVQQTFTMELWVKPDAGVTLLPEARNAVLWPAGQRFAIYPEPGDLTYGFQHTAVGISVGTNGVNVLEHASDQSPALLVQPASLSGWTHLAVVFDQGRPSLYINGLLARRGLDSLRFVHPGTSLSPPNPSANGGYYSGLLDEVRVWNVARTEPAIRRDMHRFLTGEEANLVRYWRLDDAGSGRVRDASPGQHEGTVDGASPVPSDSPLGCAYVSDVRVAAMALDGADLDVWLQGNGAGGTFQLAWGDTTDYGFLTEEVAIAPEDRDRRLTLHVGRPELGQELFYRTKVTSVGVESAPMEGRVWLTSLSEERGLKFDGVTGEVSMPIQAFAGIERDFTVEFWCQPTGDRTPTADSADGIIAMGTQRFVLYPAFGPFFNGSGSAGAGVSVGTNGITVVEHGEGHWVPVLVQPLELSGWNHVAVVYSNGLPRLFLNGQHVRDGWISGRRVGPGSGLGGGPAVLDTTPYYQGSLDEMRVWRRALTGPELGAVMYRALTPPIPGLVWCQHFDEGSGSLAREAVDASRTNTLNAGVAWIASIRPTRNPIPCTLLPDGSPRIRFSTAPAQVFILSRSADLEVWESISTNTASAGGIFEYTDSESANLPMRFYRLIDQP